MRTTFLLSLASALTVLSVTAVETGASWSPALATISCLIVIAVAIRTTGGGWLSASTAYASLFFLFHSGLLLLLALGRDVSFFRSSDTLWAAGPGLTHAAGLVAFAASAFLFGQTLSATFRLPGSRREPRTPNTSRDAGRSGIVLLGVGLVLWFGVVLTRGGLGLLLSDYGTFLRATAGSPLVYSYLFIGVGMAFSAAANSMKLRVSALAGFTIWGLPAAAIGLRGEVLLPVIAYAVAAHKLRPIAFRFRYVSMVVAGLGLGSFIRVGRGAGVGDGGGGWDLAAFSPQAGLIEMGYSLRPVVESWRWHGSGNESAVGLSTYLASLERIVLGRIAGLPTTPTREDPRTFSATIYERVGPIGGSPVAEAFRADGLVGIFVVFVILGGLLALLDRRRRAALSAATTGGILYVLLLWVRNDFTPVVPGLLFVALCTLSASAAHGAAKRRTHLPTGSQLSRTRDPPQPVA